MKTLSDIAKNNTQTVKKELNAVSLGAQMQEAGLKDMEKVRFTVHALNALGRL